MLVHRLPAWPADLSALKDDTEEDLVGSDLHQDAIQTLFEGLWLAGPGRGLPWHVSRQLMVLMGQVGSKVDWRPSPDILVQLHGGSAPLTSFDAEALGVPPLVMEVASPSTFAYDVGAKRDGYLAVGVREYLVFDPTGELLGEAVRAWRAEAGMFVPWRAGSDGHWQSHEVPVTFQPEGLELRVYDADDRRLPTFREQDRLRVAALLQAEEERRQADAERRRAEHLEQQADEERRRADEERRRADEERRRADELARRLAELEDRLGLDE
jgi:Uma2 family endonuclease